MVPMSHGNAGVPNANDSYLPPFPGSAPITRKLHLVSIEQYAHTRSEVEERFLAYGWRHLTPAERDALFSTLEHAWDRFSITQRNMLVIQALGSNPSYGNTPPWSTSFNLAKILLDRVQNDVFPVDDFSDVLYLRVSRRLEVEQTGMPLLDPHVRAFHFFSLLTSSTADDIAFAFVVSYRPQVLFVDAPRPLNGPVLTLMQDNDETEAQLPAIRP